MAQRPVGRVSREPLFVVAQSDPVGDVKFGREWADSRVLQVQFQHIKGTDLGQFKNLATQFVIMPAQYKSGDVIYPYELAK